jgi:serine/threonine-protein kinase
MSFKETRSFKILIITGSVLLFVILMDNVIMPWYVDLGKEIEMPDVVQSNINEARFLLEKQGFVVHITDSVYDANFPVESVVEQLPVAYSTVKQGRNVYLKVSIGDKPIVMPNLFGMSPRDAELKLKASSLDVRAVLQAYNPHYPEGVVIAQNYPHGEHVRKDTKVTITVSLGPMPADKRIPNLIGKSLSAARQQLNQLGVSVGEIEYEDNNSYLPNTILNQNIKEGTPVGESTSINLTVSRLSEDE